MIKHRAIFDTIEQHTESPEAIVVTGMRRTGKTTLLQYFYQRLGSKNKLFLDLENPLNRKIFDEDNYDRIKNSFEAQGVSFTKKSYIFLDEIQFMPNIPSVIKFFIDHYNVKFFLTGSASFYMKNLFTESLAGRKYLFELYPLTFKEFLTFKDRQLIIPKKTSKLTKATFDSISTLYDEYMFYGGFPGVVLKSSVEEKKITLEDIFTSFFQLEIIQLGDFKRNEVIRDLMLLLMQRIGSKLDISKLSKELGISRPTLAGYISFLEATYFIKTLKPFSMGKDTEIRKASKVYVCDCGLANHIARLDQGHLFENCVFQSLRGIGKLHYYQRKRGLEIDFIVNKADAYEVKLFPYESDIRKLQNLATDIGLRSHYIVSKNYCDLQNITYGFML